MPIDVECPNCGSPGRVADDLAGGDVKCYGCGKVYPAIAAFPVDVDDGPPAPSKPRPRAARSRPGPEPWIYGFLEVLAFVVMGAAAFQFLAVVVIYMTRPHPEALPALGVAMVVAGSFFLGLSTFTGGVWTLLAVDVARNVRLARRAIEEGNGP